MIAFACSQCGKRFARPEATSGSVLFCECGTRMVVPWESTVPDDEPLPVAPPAGPPEPPPPAETLPPLNPWSASHRRDPSYCFNHQDTPPQHTCPDCGEHFCADCVIVLNGRARCGPCKNIYVRSLQKPAPVSALAVLAPILAIVGGPGAVLVLFMIAGAAVESRARSGNSLGGAVVFVAGLAIVVQLIALVLGALPLRAQPGAGHVTGQSLAVTGMVAAAVYITLIGEVAVLVLYALT